MQPLVLSLVLAVSLFAQQQGGRGATPAPAPKNLKVLKVATGPEVIQIMRAFTAGLGVKCEHCHVQGNFASDDNPKKEVARHMISMAMEINSKFPDGKMHVTCYTCHRGETEPKTAPEAKPAQ